MSRSDLRGGGELCSVCVCVEVAVCGFDWPFGFLFVCFVLLVERRVQTHLCRFFVFCLLVEILEEPNLCPVQN